MCAVPAAHAQGRLARTLQVVRWPAQHLRDLRRSRKRARGLRRARCDRPPSLCVLHQRSFVLTASRTIPLAGADCPRLLRAADGNFFKAAAAKSRNGARPRLGCGTAEQHFKASEAAFKLAVAAFKQAGGKAEDYTGKTAHKPKQFLAASAPTGGGSGGMECEAAASGGGQAAAAAEAGGGGDGQGSSPATPAGAARPMATCGATQVD